MATKTKSSAKRQSKKVNQSEQDSAYLLKMVLYLIVGSQWLWMETANGSRIPLPVGLIIGIIFAMHDHFQIDRKIEYAVLLIAMLIGFIANIGIFFSV